MKNLIINFCSVILFILLFLWIWLILFYIIFFPLQDVKSPYFDLKNEIECLFWLFLNLYLIYSSYYSIRNLNRIGITIYNFIVALIPVLIAFTMFICTIYL